MKREKALLDQQLNNASTKAKYHDEHLRVIDAWLRQVGSLQRLTQQTSLTNSQFLNELTINYSLPGASQNLTTGRFSRAACYDCSNNDRFLE